MTEEEILHAWRSMKMDEDDNTYFMDPMERFVDDYGEENLPLVNPDDDFYFLDRDGDLCSTSQPLHYVEPSRLAAWIREAYSDGLDSRQQRILTDFERELADIRYQGIRHDWQEELLDRMEVMLEEIRKCRKREILVDLCHIAGVSSRGVFRWLETEECFTREELEDNFRVDPGDLDDVLDYALSCRMIAPGKEGTFMSLMVRD